MTLEELCENIEHREQYDGVIASEVVEHVNDVDGFIGNIHKLLKVNRKSNLDKRKKNQQRIRLASRSLFYHNVKSNDSVVFVGNITR